MRVSFLSSLLSLFFPLPEAVVVARSRSAEQVLVAVHIEYAEAHRTYTALHYSDPGVRALIRGNKYYNDQHSEQVLSIVLGDLLQAVIEEEALTLQGRPLLIVPTPTAPERARRRGRHQVKALCRRAALPQSVTYADVLLRANRTSQIDVPKGARERNIAGAFSVPDHLRAQVAGKNVLVVDDVSETGATMKDMHRALYEAGAQVVIGVALAR